MSYRVEIPVFIKQDKYNIKIELLLELYLKDIFEVIQNNSRSRTEKKSRKVILW